MNIIFKRPYFIAGLAARLACAPFLLQWFHPDERQMLELSHFFAHGRLHPFMEWNLQMRNLSTPWIFSQLIRICDVLGLTGPRPYLWVIQSVIGLVSWICLALLVENIRARHPTRQAVADGLGWFFALFWGFSFLYSRGLLEAIALPPAILLWLAISRGRYFRAGIWAGLGTALRYPGALWGIGAFALVSIQQRKDRVTLGKSTGLGLLGAAAALAGMGIADWAVYGRFLGSAWNYWSFNQPHGPVEKVFGNDSLLVYWRWFEFLFGPWVAPLFIMLGCGAILAWPALLIFILPYLIGHIWTPHREPRFMLPLTPFMAYALAEAWAGGKFDAVVRWYRQRPLALKRVATAIAALHVVLNFAWFPLHAWGQYSSAQAAAVLGYDAMSEASDVFGFADPLIDALVPPATRWADAQCQWHRPDQPAMNRAELWVLRDEPPPGCAFATGRDSFPQPGPWLQRILRVRVGRAWRCLDEAGRALCPQGLTPEPKQEPVLWSPDLCPSHSPRCCGWPMPACLAFSLGKAGSAR